MRAGKKLEDRRGVEWMEWRKDVQYEGEARRGCENHDILPTSLAKKPPHNVSAQRVLVRVDGEVVFTGDCDFVCFDGEVRCVGCVVFKLAERFRRPFCPDVLVGGEYDGG